MEYKKYIIALEIGSSKIVGVAAETDSLRNTITVGAIEEEKATDCVRYGCIQNVEETKSRISQIIKRLEYSIAPYKIKGVYLGVSGRSLRNTEQELHHQMKEETNITDAILKDILANARNVPFTGYDILDVIPRKFFVNKTETKNPVGTFGNDISAIVNIIVAKQLLKTNLRRVIDPQTEIKDFIITPVAVAMEALSSEERQLGCMLIDFGAETTTITIYKNDSLMYLATIPLGSRNITRDIMSLNVLETRAESLKKTMGNAMENDIDSSIELLDGVKSSDISNYIVARTGEIIANINEQLNYAKLSPDDLGAGIVLLGGGAHLNGFAELLERTTKLKVKRGIYPNHVNILDQKRDSDLYIQAVSIAAMAAEKMAPNDSCTERPIAPMPEPHHTAGTAPDKPKQQKPAEPKRPSVISSFFKKTSERLKQVLDEGESDEEDV